MNDVYCANVSREGGEPLAGSAVASTDRVIVLEHENPWGPKGVEDSGLPEDVVAYLKGLGARHPRVRVQLARRMTGSDNWRLYLAECGESDTSLRTLSLSGCEELLTLDLDGWLRGTAPAPGTLEREPLYLVCVHGKRDRCCARLGLPVYRALGARGEARVLQTTHLGGHRFAATLLVLPLGLCYGRVQADEAEALMQATERGELHDLTRVRGRIAYPSAAQAAEVLLRERLSERRADALVLEGVHEAEGAYEVRFVERATGRAHAVQVRSATLGSAPQSCGAAPKPVRCLLPVLPAAEG